MIGPAGLAAIAVRLVAGLAVAGTLLALADTPAAGALRPAGAVRPAGAAVTPWPGSSTAAVADHDDELGGNLSGLAVVATSAGTRLWAVRDGPSALLLLEPDGASWRVTPGWGDGRLLRFADGSGAPDAEGVTTVGGLDGVVYVAAERDNDRPAVSRNAILRYETTNDEARGAAGDDDALVATAVWELGDLLPTTAANTGIEGIAWVPDTVVVDLGLRDATGAVYDPAAYPGHGEGLFVVGVEATGELALFALAEGEPATLVTSIASGQPAVMEVVYDPARRELWALCDDRCGGVAAVLAPDPTTRTFAVRALVAPPSDLARRNHEGFTFATVAGCAAPTTAVYWSDDSAADGHALRTAELSCADLTAVVAAAPGAAGTAGTTATAGSAPPVTAASTSDTASSGTASSGTASSGTVTAAAPTSSTDTGRSGLLRGAVVTAAAAFVTVLVLRRKRRRSEDLAARP